MNIERINQNIREAEARNAAEKAERKAHSARIAAEAKAYAASSVRVANEEGGRNRNNVLGGD